MKVLLSIAISVVATFAITAGAYAQAVQNIGTDPLTGESYSCVAYQVRSDNRISIKDKKGKSKTLKISIAGAKVADHLTDAKKQLKEVTKTAKAKAKELAKLYDSFTGPLYVTKIAKLETEVKKLNLKVAELTANVALLTQLKKLVSDCKEAVPVNSSILPVSGIFPPGVPGAGEYYAFVIVLFTPNVADHYCATIESRNQSVGGDRGLFKVASNVCARYNLPECFDIYQSAGLLVYTKIGANRPGTCKNVGDVCDLTTAIADMNEFLATFKFYDIKPANGITDFTYCDKI
jgi:hypothetical protein